MSYKLVDLVMTHYDGSATEKLVLMALAKHGDDDGKNCYPSVRTLAVLTRLGARSVKYALKQLRERRVISLLSDAKGGLRQNTNHFEIHVQTLEGMNPLTGAKVAPVQEVHGCKEAKGGVQPLHPTGANAARVRVHQLHPTLSFDSIQDSIRGKRKTSPPDLAEEITNFVCEQTNLTRKWVRDEIKKQAALELKKRDGNGNVQDLAVRIASEMAKAWPTFTQANPFTNKKPEAFFGEGEWLKWAR